MKTKKSQRICPVEESGGLDSSFRKLLQNPEKILKPFVNRGEIVMDMGCGPGFFTLPMAELVGENGKVIAVDLQKGMLDIVESKIKGSAFEKTIELHQCDEDKIGLSQKVDFALAFYMVHEVPDQEKLLNEFYSILNSGGRLLIAEPLFHVNRKAFKRMLDIALGIGFKLEKKVKIFFSRGVILQKENN